MRVARHRVEAIGRGFLAAGGTLEEWAEVLRELPDLREPGTPMALAKFARVQLYGDLLDRWYTDLRWLDERSAPRPLGVTGPHGFAALCRTIGRAREARALAREGCFAGIFWRDSRGRLRPTDRTALVRRGPLYSDAIGLVLTEWQATQRHNQSPTTDLDARRIERGIYGMPISRALEPEAQRVARQYGSEYIHQFSDWLRARAPAPDDTDVVHVGLQVVAFTHGSDATPVPRKRRRRG